jgi:hypothetical protein
MDHVSFIMAYEGGELESVVELIDGFASLIRSGTIRHLQGSYGRMAHQLISAGFIDNDGRVLCYPADSDEE